MSSKRLNRSAGALLIASHGLLFLALGSEDRWMIATLLIAAAGLLLMSLFLWLKALRRTAQEAEQKGEIPEQNS